MAIAWLPTAPSSTSNARTALVRWLIGLTSTQACSQPGMVSVRAKMFAPKVSGKPMSIAVPCTLRGFFIVTPSTTKIHDIANAKTRTSPTAARAENTSVWTRNPIAEPKPNTIAIETTYRHTSPSAAPASGVNREIGRDRKRSKTPLEMSSHSATPVPSDANTTVWTRIPGSTNWR